MEKHPKGSWTEISNFPTCQFNSFLSSFISQLSLRLFRKGSSDTTSALMKLLRGTSYAALLTDADTPSLLVAWRGLLVAL
jgi:hypothetical protein